LENLLIRLVAFDFNGTLIDDSPLLVGALNAVFVALGRPALSRAQIAARLGLPWTDLYRGLGVSTADASDAEIGRLYREAYLAGPAPMLYPDVIPALRELNRRGDQTVILSAQEERMTRTQLSEWPDLLAAVGELLGGIDDKAGALRDLAARHSLPITQIAYVGDQASDMTEALAAGALAVGRLGGIGSATRLRRAGAAILVADLAQLPDLLAAF
jgi:phosphoglycolate phosphatase